LAVSALTGAIVGLLASVGVWMAIAGFVGVRVRERPAARGRLATRRRARRCGRRRVAGVVGGDGMAMAGVTVLPSR
jgi:hypothetical protein